MEFEITREIRELAEKIAGVYKTNLEPHRSSGKLQSFRTVTSIKGDYFLIQFDIEDYWKYVEYGRPPGKYPPIGSIEKWISVKPIIPDSRFGKVPTTKQLAFMISRKISREGTRGTKPLERSLESPEVKTFINAIKQEFVSQVISYIESSAKGD